MLAGPGPIFVHRRGRRLRRLGFDAHALADGTHRGNAVVHSHGAQRIVVAAAQDDAAPAEARVLADFPAAAVDDDRRGAIVEAEALEIADGLVGGERAPAETL